MLGFLSTGSKWLATHEMSRNYRPKIQESPVSQRYRDGAGEALRLKFFFRFLSTTPITYAFGLFSCWTHCWTFRSTLGLAPPAPKTPSGTIEIPGGTVGRDFWGRRAQANVAPKSPPNVPKRKTERPKP